MVSERHRIKAKLVHGFCNLFATVVAIEQRSLKFVANINPKAVVMVRTLRVYDMFDARVTAIAAFAWIRAIGARGTKFVQMSVDIIDVKESYRE